MSENLLPRHGLDSLLPSLPTDANDDDGVRVEIRGDLGHINLRGNSLDPVFLATIARVLEQELPITANTLSTGEHRIYWLGPNEWQVVTAIDVCNELVGQLREGFSGLSASVSDLSGGYTALQVDGARVRNTLAKGCTLDLDRFDVTDCAQTGLAKASMLIGYIDEAGPVFEIVVRRSFADYAVRWLKHAASGYGVSFSATSGSAL